MKPTIEIHTSEMNAWYTLIEKAKGSLTIQLSEELQSYLVFLLMRFMKEPTVLNEVLAFEYLQNIRPNKSENLKALRNVGDKCLLLTGLFPERAKRRRVEISYYVNLGQNAYSILSAQDQTQLSKLYAAVGHEFVRLMDVLHSIRALDITQTHFDLFQAEDLFATHQSNHALKVLEKTTHGFFIPRNHLDQNIKH